jgi:hypothetical protein
MRRWALVGLTVMLLVSSTVTRIRALRRAPVAPLGCREAVSVVDASGERLACLDDPALTPCGRLVPGFRYQDCQRAGPIAGAVLLLRSALLSASQATESDFVALQGIGPSLAARIIAFRQAGPLCAVDDLAHVSGIGPKRAQSIGAHLSFDDPRCGPRDPALRPRIR